jgi:hypothetical protein
MQKTEKIEGVVQEVKAKPMPSAEQPGRMLFSFKVNNAFYSTFDANIGSSFIEGNKVLIEFWNKNTNGKTYHNITKMALLSPIGTTSQQSISKDEYFEKKLEFDIKSLKTGITQSALKAAISLLEMQVETKQITKVDFDTVKNLTERFEKEMLN